MPSSSRSRWRSWSGRSTSSTGSAPSGDIDVAAELDTLEAKLQAKREEIYRGLSPMQRVMVARHPRRPYTLDYLSIDLH